MVALSALALATCTDPPLDHGPLVRQPASHPVKKTDERLPVTPIKLQKPRILGPVTPAIVVLPQDYSEPLIRVRLTSEMDNPPAIKKGSYRGKVEAVRLANGKYIGLNTLPLDSYLQGVLAKELYGSWDIETYKTQAVAARTYAVYQISTDGASKPWDVTNDESSQMYGGIAGETAKSRQAVAATRGQIMLGKFGAQSGVFCAYYSACNGGATQDPFDAWGDFSLDVLAARKTGSIDSNCPKYTWPAMTVTKTALSRCIRNWGARNGFSHLLALGPITRVTINKRNATTGRPTELLLTDAAGRSSPIRAEEFRLALVYDPAGETPKPFSSWFEIVDSTDRITLTNGKGYGHGIGMSQWGAQALALQGSGYKQILNFYYPGAVVKKAW